MKKNYLNSLNINDKNAAVRLLGNLADLSERGLERLERMKNEADLLAEYNRRAMALKISIDNYYYDYCDILRLAIKSTAPVTHLVVPDYNDELFFEPLGIYLDNGDMCFIYQGLYYKGHGTSDEISRTLQNAVNKIARLRRFNLVSVHLVLTADNDAIFYLSPLRRRNIQI